MNHQLGKMLEDKRISDVGLAPCREGHQTLHYNTTFYGGSTRGCASSDRAHVSIDHLLDSNLYSWSEHESSHISYPSSSYQANE